MTYQLTIIIPVYNELENLNRLEVELDAFIETAKISTTVLLINDGSNDGSQAAIKNICLRKDSFNFISFDRNYGLSAALKAGFDHAKTNLIGYMDADLQTNPQDFNLLLDHIDKFDMVMGFRSSRKDSISKKISSTIANSFRRLFTGDGIKDTGCPLKIIKSSYAKQIPMFKGLHRFLPAMVQLQNGTVKQIPVRHYSRIAGKNKFGLRNRLIRPMIDCLAFLWMKRRYLNYKISKKG